MANQYNAKTNEAVEDLIDTITTAVGNSFQVDFSYSPGFTLTLQVSDDGQSLAITAKPGAPGGPNNPFYAPDSGPGIPNTSTHFTTGPAFVVDANLIPT